MLLITPELKDKLLDEFVTTNQIAFTTSECVLAEFLSVDRSVVRCLLNHFEDIGLCTIKRNLGGNVCVILNAKAYDMYRRGGFAAEEYLYQKELLKLEKELDKLCKTFPDKVSLFSAAINAIGVVKTFFND